MFYISPPASYIGIHRTLENSYKSVQNSANADQGILTHMRTLLRETLVLAHFGHRVKVCQGSIHALQVDA